MQCTMQWSPPEFNHRADLKDQPHEILLQRHRAGGYRSGCQKAAVYEVCQRRSPTSETETYHIGFNCDSHVPIKTAQNYVITEIK